MSNKVPTTGQFGTTSPTDTYPVFEDVDGLGGWRVVADANAMNAIPSERRKEGMEVKLSSTGKIYELKNGQFVLKSAEISSGAVQSVNGKTGIVNLVKSDIGLGNVDNTADANKEVLSATKLKTARTIALTGGVAGSGSFDGSSNLSITTTLRALVAADIPSLDWAKITTGKPTTVAGYGITDAVKYQSSQSAPAQTIYGDIIVIGKIYSSDDIVAFSDGTGGGAAPTIPLATYTTTGVVKVDPTTLTVDANGMIAVKGDLFNLSNYYDKSASDGRFAALGHVHAFSELTGKPTTIAGYGITDAVKNTGGTIAGDLTITGNLYLQQGGKFIVTEKVYSENDFITLRYNNPSLLAAGAYTGFEAKKVFSDGSDGYLVFGNDGMARVGKMASLQMLATREDIPTDGAIQYYSAANKRLTSGVLASDLWHKGNLRLDDIQGYRFYQIDTRGLDENTYYPVLFNSPAYGWARFIIRISFDDNKPSWGAHPSGAVAKLIWESNGNGWGSEEVSRNIITSNYAFTDKSPISAPGQMENSSFEYVYVRGGGIYWFSCSNMTVIPTLKTSTFTINYQSISPTTTPCLDPSSATAGYGIAVNTIRSNNLLTKTQTLRAADGSVKWTIQLNASNALEYYNASGALVVRISQAGKIQAKDDIEAFSNFN